MINVSYYFVCASLPMRFHKKLVDPHDDVVLKRAFDDLMEQVRSQELMDVGSSKAICEWLEQFTSEREAKMAIRTTYDNVSADSKIAP
jgi:hypothetical protein